MPKKHNKKIIKEKSLAAGVRIRMYRQGLGDCFLLRFPRANGKSFHIVIDSGVIKGTADSAVRMRAVADDIVRETNGRIDALVVTHEHWDHVSGFTQARDVWEQTGLEIAELWLAWTENPENKLAAELRKDREARKSKIKAKIASLAGSTSLHLDGARSGRINALLGFLGFGLGAVEAGGGTRQALDFIKGRATKTLYLDPGTVVKPGKIPNVRTYVLGPPQDRQLIKRSNPSQANPEVYSEPRQSFAFFDPAIADQDTDCPFGAGLGVEVKDAAAYDQFLTVNFPNILDPGETDPFWRRLTFESLEELEGLALALDGDTNNTSLALAFELNDGRVLLFPADAQVGNWLSWQGLTWKDGTKSVSADELLARTVLYKVGHHGSHNATLKEHGLEKMTHRDLIAIVPVNEAMARKKHWKMPYPPLHQRLKEKARGRVLLSDANKPLLNAEQLTGLTAAEQQRFIQQVSASDLFIDITL